MTPLPRALRKNLRALSLTVAGPFAWVFLYPILASGARALLDAAGARAFRAVMA